MNVCFLVLFFLVYGLVFSLGMEWGGGLSDFVWVLYVSVMFVRVLDGLLFFVVVFIFDNVIDGYCIVVGFLCSYLGVVVLVVGGFV